ncbi:TRAP transporter substrate-binding protein DctP [Pseudonocardia nematodicida]|uniref:TRAP transporter substrate-binding protein DctP n=1 Tax=Pseudonocardia nematodicida TaxID=1206997 RepID=A0ABV1KBW0_9PSEU
MVERDTGPPGPRRNRRGRVVAALAALLLLAGCGFGGRIDASEIPTAPGEPGDTVLRLANAYESVHPVNACGVPAMQEVLLGSGITVEAYPSAQLGTEAESLEQVAAGGLDLTIAGPSFLGVWHDPAAVLDAAYLFDTVEGFTAAVEGDVIAGVHEDFRERSGMRVLSSIYYGTRHTTSNRPISAPADFAGLKLRTPDAPLYLINTAVMGGTATPMALGEVYLALQQGTLDAQENPVPTIASAGFDEVQQYLNLTGHIVQAVHLVTNDEINSALDPEQRDRLDEAAAAGSAATRECVLREEREQVEAWQQDGSITVNPVDTAAFARQAHEQIPERVAWGDLYTELREER